jgi:serine/threonine protein kinase
MPDTLPPLPPADPLIGHVLDNKYELVKLLGSGGMGSVYRARRLSFEAPDVAIKILHQQIVDPDTRTRFKREASAAANLSHPNIVIIHDFVEGKDAQSLGYIVMELLEGTPLSEILKDEKQLEPQRATSLMCDVCEGVNFAHLQGVIHRDLKPHNIVVLPAGYGRRNETVKIVDFGLAKLRPGEGTAPADSLTPRGAIMGTPLYMSPEACQGEKLDARSDIYSLGATMYHMLAGQPPFIANNALQLQWKHVHDQPPPLPGDGPTLRALEVVIKRALEKKPDRRQQDALMFADELRKALQPTLGEPRQNEFAIEPDEVGATLVEQSKRVFLKKSPGHAINNLIRYVVTVSS